MKRLTEAIEIIDHKTDHAPSPVFITCEHASNRLPPPYTWPEADKHIASQHWAYDIGAEDLARELRQRINAVALLSRFSRLLIDPNRPISSDTLIRDVADGKPIQLNQKLSAEEKALRMSRFYQPYHAALRQIVSHPARQYRLILAIHSYTDNYEGQKRDVQIGVLYKSDSALASKLKTGFAHLGYDARLNEPWSGKDGFMYAADSVASPPGRRAIMLEFRNDLLAKPVWRKTVMEQLVTLLEREKIL